MNGAELQISVEIGLSNVSKNKSVSENAMT